MTELTTAIDKLSFNDLVGKRLGSIPNLNGMTNAYIEKRIPWLHMNYEIASNTCLKNETPYFREYIIPFYRNEDKVQVQEIDLGFYDPDLEGRYFYRVVHFYYEHQYSSTYPFYQWEYTVGRFRHETLRYKTISSQYRWERELLSYQHENLPTQYINFSSNLIQLKVDMNSGIGIEVKSDSPFSILIKDKTYESSDNSFSLSIVDASSVLIKSAANRQIHQFYRSNEDESGYITHYLVNLNDGDSTTLVFPTFIQINILGEKIASRTYYPEGEIEELEKELIHSPSVSLDNRLIPPGKSKGDPDFPTKFWNYKGKPHIDVSTSISSLSEPSQIKEL